MGLFSHSKSSHSFIAHNELVRTLSSFSPDRTSCLKLPQPHSYTLPCYPPAQQTNSTINIKHVSQCTSDRRFSSQEAVARAHSPPPSHGSYTALYCLNHSSSHPICYPSVHNADAANTIKHVIHSTSQRLFSLPVADLYT